MWDQRPTRVLLVDDDVRLTDAVARYLKRDGYDVLVAHDGPTAIEAARSKHPDLIVLDVMMPRIDGWEVCRRVRETSNVPIIMLTARANETDRVLGLRMGADDYVDKPFSLKELEARIEAVLRRTNLAPAVEDDCLYDDGRLRLLSDGMLALRDGEAISLTATERRLLFALAERAGRVMAPSQILQQVWGPEYEGQSDYVKLYIWRLRQKLEPDPADPIYILTERGLGYRFAPTDSAD